MDEQNLTRRGLFTAGGSVLGAVALTVGAPARADGDAAAQARPAAPPAIAFDLEHMPIDPESGPGGTVQMARQRQFPFMSAATIARATVKPNASRSPHWHINSWEVQFCVSGSCKLSTVDEHGVLHESVLKPGFAGFAPQGWLHAIEAVGTETCVLYLCWGDPDLKTQELAEAMGQLPREAVAGALGVPQAQLAAVNRKRILVNPNR